MKSLIALLILVFTISSCKTVKPKNQRPVLTVAGIVHICPQNKIALIERGKVPFGLAMFGGHVENESPEDAFMRELKEELNISEVKNMKLIGVHGKPGRDPRQHSVEITYSIRTNQNPIAGDDAKSVQLYTKDEIFQLIKEKKFAFDHGEILERYLSNLKNINICKNN